MCRECSSRKTNPSKPPMSRMTDEDLKDMLKTKVYYMSRNDLERFYVQSVMRRVAARRKRSSCNKRAA